MGGSSRVGDFSQGRGINGSDDGTVLRTKMGAPGGVAQMEREEADRLAGPKLIR